MSNFNAFESEELNRIFCARRMKHVTRLAGTPTITRQSLAEHCYYTGLLFVQVAAMEGVNVTPEDVAFVFMHDIAEVVTGDLLWPAKHSGENNEHWDVIEETALRDQAPFLLPYTDNTLKGDALKLFRACDMLELHLCVCEETRLGNTSRELRTVLDNSSRFLANQGFETIKRIADVFYGMSVL